MLSGKIYPSVFGILAAGEFWHHGWQAAINVLLVFLVVSAVDVWLLPERWRLP